MTYPHELAFPEWKLPRTPLEVRVAPDGRVACLLVWFNRDGIDARWLCLGSTGEIEVEILTAEAVEGWQVVHRAEEQPPVEQQGGGE